MPDRANHALSLVYFWYEWGKTAPAAETILTTTGGRVVLIDWHWYKDLSDEQRGLYEELVQIETEIYLSPRDCKQLVKGLTRIGIKTPAQLREWFIALAQAEDD